MKKAIFVKCDKCKKQIEITKPEQINKHVDPYRILCDQCSEWENNTTDW